MLYNIRICSITYYDLRIFSVTKIFHVISVKYCMNTSSADGYRSFRHFISIFLREMVAAESIKNSWYSQVDSGNV